MENYEPWPDLPYNDFKSTAHLLHMLVQAIGKLKLNTPFEPHWANVALWLNSRGLTTGIIPYQQGSFTIDLDLIDHKVIGTTSAGLLDTFTLGSMSVADCVSQLFLLLNRLQIDIKINMLPQELPEPIAFDKDTIKQSYDNNLANAWWRILLSTYRVMLRYHAKFHGETPPIGFMWGTFDLRDARYYGKKIATTGINAGYIRRNAMDQAQVEVGWWHGNDMYQQPAYYAFIYPTPAKIEQATVQPKSARWEKSLSEFILDYKDIRLSEQPERDLMAFFESTYQAGANLAKWGSDLITKGEPV